MEPNEKENKQDKSPSSTQQDASERVETPFPAQEIFPLDQGMNDGKHKDNAEKLKEEAKGSLK